jgi:N-acetylneuraminic acid mutarotase
MPTKRSDTSIGTLGNVILVSGGCDRDQICPNDLDFCVCESISAVVEAYSPSADQWSTLAPMPQARYRHAAAVVGDDMYLFGGRHLNDSVVREIDVLHYGSNTWETLATRWEDAASDLVAVAVGSYIYVISGYTQDYATRSTVSLFDTVTKAWQPVRLSEMAVSRGDACAAVIDSRIYVVGGFNGNNFCEALDSLEVYDTVANTWTSKRTMDRPRGDAACGALHGEFHAVGGEEKNNRSSCVMKYDIAIEHVEHYHPPTNTWSEETPLESVRFRFVGAAFGDSFYVFGGQGAMQGTTYPILDTVEAWEDTNAAAIGSLSVALLVLCLAAF